MVEPTPSIARPKALAPGWARGVIGAALGSAIAHAWRPRDAIGVDAALLVGAAVAIASIAELSRPRFRRGVPIACGIAVALTGLLAWQTDQEGLLFLGLPLFLATRVLADAPPVAPDASRISRGGCRDALAPLGFLLALGASCLVFNGMFIIFDEVGRRVPEIIRGELLGGVCGAVSTFAVDLASRIAWRARPSSG